MAVADLLDETIQGLKERHAFLAPLVEEFHRIDRALDVLAQPLENFTPKAPQAKAEKRVKADPVHVAKADATSKRKPPVKLDLAVLRGWIYEHPGEFTTADVVEQFGVAPMTALRQLRELIDKGTVRKIGDKRTTRWAFVKPEANGAAPRPKELDPSIAAGNGSAVPVPGTGVPQGPASSPMALRRQQIDEAARVKKPKRQGY